MRSRPAPFDATVEALGRVAEREGYERARTRLNTAVWTRGDPRALEGINVEGWPTDDPTRITEGRGISQNRAATLGEIVTGVVAQR